MLKLNTTLCDNFGYKSITRNQRVTTCLARSLIIQANNLELLVLLVRWAYFVDIRQQQLV